MAFITLTRAFTVHKETQLPSNGTQSLFHASWANNLQEALQIPTDIRWVRACFCRVFAAVDLEAWLELGRRRSFRMTSCNHLL